MERHEVPSHRLSNARKFQGEEDPLYQVLNPRIGQGISRVAKVRRTVDGKLFACKIFRLKPYRSSSNKLETELSSLAIQSTRGLLPTLERFDWKPDVAIKEQNEGDQDTEVRIYMPYCNLGSLQDIIERREDVNAHVDEKDVISVFLNLNRELEKVHVLKNLLHRDIKPANVLLHSPKWSQEVPEVYLSRLNKKTEVFLSDWDVSRHYHVLASDTNYNNTGFQGTQGFIAPECYRPPYRCDENSDRYALGYTMFCLCELRTSLSASETTQQSVSSLGGQIRQVPNSSTVDKWTTAGIYSKELRSLIDRLTDDDPKVRPTYSTTLSELLKMEYAIWKSANGWGSGDERDPGYLTDEMASVGLIRDGTRMEE